MQSSSDPNTYFENRADAARQLISVLPSELFKDKEPIVIAVSEGGVYFADQIAKEQHCAMDILLTEAILAPNNEDLAIAMVSETEEVVMHKALIDSFGISEDYVYGEAQRKYDDEVLSYVYKYRKGKDILPLEGRYVVLVDECAQEKPLLKLNSLCSWRPCCKSLPFLPKKESHLHRLRARRGSR